MRNNAAAPPVALGMTTIGLIGSGHIGSTLARLAIAAGYDVVLSNSRGPETLADLVAQLGDRARAGTSTEAAEAGDVVVVTVPLNAYREVPVGPLAGKVVLDTNNYYPDRDGRVAELDDESTTTSELLQAHLPDSLVVKAFNNIYFEDLAELPRPADAPDRTTLPIAGNDDAAKQTAADVIDRLGYDVLDAGALAEGWRAQRDTPVYVAPYRGADGGSTPAGADRIAALLAEARRYGEG
ncbi:NADPH-dependent F420 reductase [Georgenia sunbinii]|uniref:NADPH-dependent F420 reductase n=1 Tax=Georgenia sunbinii TaxID=3117728 RepID=UPI002F2623D6